MDRINLQRDFVLPYSVRHIMIITYDADQTRLHSVPLPVFHRPQELGVFEETHLHSLISGTEFLEQLEF